MPEMNPGVSETEPWMRDTHRELDPLRRGVVHALELAEEDAARWGMPLSDAELFARLSGLPPVAFHLRHTARSLDRLLTYAAGQGLNKTQLEKLGSEAAEGSKGEVWQEFTEGLRTAKERVLGFKPETFSEVRGIGRKQLPTTVGGLLVHCAEHTARHVGQMVTTAKLLTALRRA